MNENAIVRISDNNPEFTTIIANSTEEKIRLYNSVQNPTEKVSDYINREFTFKDIYMEKATYVSEDGVITEGVKTVLIAEDGHGILANSNGVANSLYQILKIFGMPDEWGGNMKVSVLQIETPNGRYFKLKVVAIVPDEAEKANKK